MSKRENSRHGFVMFLLFGMTGIGLMFLAGCGYRFSGSGSLPGSAKSIYIKLFENKSAEPGIEANFTSDLMNELIRNGRSIKKDEESAESILSGTIQSIFIESVGSRKSDIPSKKEMVVVVDAKLVSKKGKNLWVGRGITERISYDSDGESDDITNSFRREAVYRISARIAERIYTQMTDQF